MEEVIQLNEELDEYVAALEKELQEAISQLRVATDGHKTLLKGIQVAACKLEVREVRRKDVFKVCQLCLNIFPLSHQMHIVGVNPNIYTFYLVISTRKFYERFPTANH